MDEQAWQQKSAAILTEIKAWRQAHPTATFVEIEAEVHRRLMELEAQVLQDAAQASASREWGYTSGQAGPVCPTCGIPLEARGQHQRTLQGNGGESVQLSRTYGTCPKCGAGLFPLDEELGLLPGTLAPRQHEHLVHLASCMPFKQAAQLLGALLGVQISTETARRLAERMGTHMETAQTAEADPAVACESTDQPAPERCVVSVDGAMISLVHQQWVEVRTLAIGQPHEQHAAEGEPEVHVDQLSYFSRLADAATFTELADVEVRRRRVREAQQVCVVTDGADWCQAFPERHRPDAVRILDFPHAAEHLSKVLEAVKEVGLPVPAQMLERCLHILKHRGPRPLLHIADRFGSELAQHKGIQEHLDYLRKREALMHYPAFRDQGWPIGSGMVESANKLVVQARLKGAGMHWERRHVNPLLALRTAVCNERWQEMWHLALTHHRKLKVLHRSARAKQRTHPAPEASHPCEASTPATPLPSAASPAPVPSSGPFPPRAERPAARRERHLPRRRVSASPAGPAGLSRDMCLCGTPLARCKGHRPKQYCSDRCRQRAHRSRQARLASPCSAHQLKREAHEKQTRLRLQRSRPPFVRKDPQTCPCGAPLVRVIGHRPREYCSDRCRQRARRERQGSLL